MITKALAATVVAATVMCATAPAVSAADLYERGSYRTGSPYDDPRYRDIYGGYKSSPPARYVERRELAPPAIVYSERERRQYLAPMPPPAYVDQRHWLPGRETGCVPRKEIRRALAHDGWYDLHGLDFRGSVAVVFGHRPDGRQYRIKIDRCTGTILSTKLVDHSARDYAANDYEYEPDDRPRSSGWNGDRAYRY